MKQQFPLWPGLLVIAGLITVVARFSPPALAATPPLVAIIAAELSINEGEQGRFVIRRSESLGELHVNLTLGGSAQLGTDYLLEGGAGFPSLSSKLRFNDGESEWVLSVYAVDDVAAEADESVLLTLQAGANYRTANSASSAVLTLVRNDTVVTTTADSGEGSLRQALSNAQALEATDSIRFDSELGPFAIPQTIVLQSALPEISGQLSIDGYIEDRLWKPSGVTLSGNKTHRVFSISPTAKVTIASLTIAEGHARQGGGIANRGQLVVKGVTLKDNNAEQAGGGLANLGGTLTLINSTLVNNQAGVDGGGLANLNGKVTVTNATFSGNQASRGSGLFNNGTLLLSNTIVANGEGAADCTNLASLDPASSHNLIEINENCGQPFSTADPKLGKLAGYNGPTQTLPPGARSPILNTGNNAAAVDEHGEPLVWDQRGNGDPRFVSGITDIGAFEQQVFTLLEVDILEDTAIRACTRSVADCSLRGAIMLANARNKGDTITFNSKIFATENTIIRLQRPLPEVTAELSLDASAVGGVTLQGSFDLLPTRPNVNLVLKEVTLDTTQ